MVEIHSYIIVILWKGKTALGIIAAAHRLPEKVRLS